jgi:hypothetical protein
MLTLHLQHPGQMRWGFEITVLDESNIPVGDLLIVDPVTTQKSVAPSGRQYIKHTAAGTYLGMPDSSEGWTFIWLAPASTTGPVTLYFAGNAANGNLNNFGDSIYTGSRVLTINTTDVESDGRFVPGAFELQQNHPNPFNPSTTIAYTLPERAFVRMGIYDIRGREVATLSDGWREAGHHSAVWNAGGFSSGIYLYRIEARPAGSGRAYMDSRKMLLLK